MASGQTLEVDGHHITVTNLAKVLYPETGTRKYDVIDYYARVADVMLPHLARRLITRKRWPNGVQSTPFFEKAVPEGIPDWVARHGVEHSSRIIEYVVADSAATLVWLAQMAALELHTPQWRLPTGDDESLQRFAAEGPKANRLVLDLDPGPEVPLRECAEVALAIHEMLDHAGLASYPVTSGGKGIHVYARFPTPVSSDSARTVARQIATTLAQTHPDAITATMAKAERHQRIFIDWSQNSAAKTTLAPYSLRGREKPWVAAPRTWDELDDPDVRQLLYTEVLERIDEMGDLLDGLDDPYPAEQSADPGSHDESPPAGTTSGQVINLREYRRKRDATATPEPFGDDAIREQRAETAPASDGPIFVIQEHRARRLHYDFRLERDGVLVSWAIPKNLPTDPDQNRLAVHTEDHPLDYADFAGDIPAGEYGGGHVEIWDRGTYETEKWRDDEVIVRLHGTRIQGRYALIRTGEQNWLAHLMTDEARPILPDSLRDPRPMLATDEPIDGLSEKDWAFEGKWDGYRILVRYVGGEFRLTSRSGLDMTADFPELASIADDLGLIDAVLDGEVVALDSAGRTNFTLLAGRNSATEPLTLKLYLFDILYLNGTSLLRTPWEQRRALLEALAPAFRHSRHVEVPPLLGGDGAAAMAHSREHHLEGVVAKRRTSTYQQGRRTSTWLKHKNWSDIEVVIGGWRPGNGNRAHTIGSLLLGLPEETGLRYVGRVGTGFTDAGLAALAAELEPLRISRSPFLDKLDRPVAANAVWVLPKIVGEVQFMDWTSTGHLRHPSWRGIRRDKLPGDL
ncbi:ATP-dependent DNA ligase [Gordonia desulfuricans]|uniref:DNA ligase (ATP) n=1 Tax=Gordonia desulfuricans TaxID=89051 RepID=A0A7K3LKK9_9ACTN|nr:ATP-dependent DNA ligase [Gordonia desulfuricans]NDK88591.1 ATP-dependent DNA ligase [Gordonia desulfuricans]